MPTGKEQIYGDPACGFLPKLYINWAIGSAGVLLVFTIIALILHFYYDSSCLLKVVWALWIVAPPIWFCYEYFWLFRDEKVTVTFETFKYGQDIASKGWLAIAALLTGILSN